MDTSTNSNRRPNKTAKMIRTKRLTNAATLIQATARMYTCKQVYQLTRDLVEAYEMLKKRCGDLMLSGCTNFDKLLLYSNTLTIFKVMATDFLATADEFRALERYPLFQYLYYHTIYCAVITHYCMMVRLECNYTFKVYFTDKERSIFNDCTNIANDLLDSIKVN